jgi:sugar O-acyltransferase (sialic acid O-acetyltransferase NeuD family)
MKASRFKKPVLIIGYSGHAYVVIDIFLNCGRLVTAYCEENEKENNPFHLHYLGRETAIIYRLHEFDYFVSIGNNAIREKIQMQMSLVSHHPVNAIHPSAVIAASAGMADGVMIAANVTINPLVRLGKGVICNTSCSIDHECQVDDFAHIAPGAVLCGNVKVGKGTFVGANSVIREGITVGKNVVIGAGTVVVKDIPDNVTVVGNPARLLVGKQARKLAIVA